MAWDSNTLKQYVDKRIHAAEKASDMAVELTAVSVEKRLDALSRLTENMVTRIEHGVVEKQINELGISVAKIEGKADQSAVNRANLFSTLGVLIGIAAIIISLIR
jgi:hypothetical protein